MDFPILIAIGLLSFLSSIPAEDGNCWSLMGNGTCACCKVGYRGQTCNITCERCKSRFLEKKCSNFCEDGYYGQTCNKPCPEGCVVDAKSKRRVCKEENGLPVCFECIHGHYGKQCSQICNENCHDTRCLMTDGSCLDCSNSQSYGDYCNISCSEGCKNNTCNRTGHCTDGCSDGFFGGKCMECGSNCVRAICTSDKSSIYNCTEGCIDEYTGTNCTEKCQPHCKKCDRQGKCKSCFEHYVLRDDTRECLKAINHIHIALGVVLSILIICGIIIGVVIWKKKRPNVSCYCNNPEMCAPSGSDISFKSPSDEQIPSCFLTSNIPSPYQSDEEQNQVCLIQGNAE